MKKHPQFFLSCLSMFFLLGTFLSFHQARCDAVKSTFTIDQQLDQLNEQVSRARILMQTGKGTTALEQLRAAATDSWKVLFSVSGTQNFLTSTDPIPATGVISRVARQAAEAHYWWGQAAEQQHSPDEAITAFARAARLCPANNDPLDLLSANINAALNQSLQNGFPQSAAPDVLQNIATFSSHPQWRMKSTLLDVPNPLGLSESTFFIWIEGDSKAPHSAPHTAPLYRNIPISQLPLELNSPQILYMYAIPASSYYSGLASLQLKVRFTDFNDTGLAAHLAQIMLQAKLMNDRFLNRESTPLTLWLETVAADWPQAIDENSPWEAAAKIDSAPDDIIVFRVHKPRTDGEWTRELIHEYGHVAWPDFKVFTPPIEPNANGILSETLGPLWLAQNVESETDDKKVIYPLIEQTALPALQNWLSEGPESQLAIGDNEQARQYLQGFCVYIDRVYGTKVLSEVMQELKNRNNRAKDILDAFPEIIANNEITSIYLPAAAINVPPDLALLIHRAPMNYAANEKVDFEIYIPPGTTQLIIPWTGEGTISNKSTFGVASSDQQKLTININGISGWRKLSLQVEGKVLLGTADFFEG